MWQNVAQTTAAGASSVLLRFETENFLSIRDRQEILLTASRHIKREGPTLPVPVLREEVLPVAVVYGANASGKTNLIEAIRHMRLHVVESHKSRDATDDIPRPHFRLDKTSALEPTRFACTFAALNADSDSAVYDYGFEFSDTEYRGEWLYRTVRQRRQTKQLMFERTTADGETHVRFGSRLGGENKAIAALTRPNSLFLSAAAQNNHPHLSSVHRQFVERCVLAKAGQRENAVAKALEDYEHKAALVQLLRQADVGVTDMEVEVVELDPAGRNEDDLVWRAVSNLSLAAHDLATLLGTDPPDKKLRRVRFTHMGHDGKYALEYDLESKGTRRLAFLAITILSALADGATVVVDELDASLHPRLVEALIRLFKGRSNHGAQLVCTMHNTDALGSVLELDEVWMADKDRDGVSRFTPITDYSVRSREDLEQVYKDGRVGGSPAVGDLAVGCGR